MATWDQSTFEAAPSGAAAPSTIDDRIRETRVEVRFGTDREHTWDNTTQAQRGYHRAGSAKVYFTTAAPTTRPDGTALDSTDKGRMWLSTSAGTRLYVRGSAAWASIGYVNLSTAQTILGLKTLSLSGFASIPIRRASSGIVQTTGSVTKGTLYGRLSNQVPTIGNTAIVSGHYYRWVSATQVVTGDISRIRRIAAGAISLDVIGAVWTFSGSLIGMSGQKGVLSAVAASGTEVVSGLKSFMIGW